MTALDNVQARPAPQPATLGQITAVEQARAVAEVQAAVVVAQNVPRDMDRVRRDMRDACTSAAMARKAFYAVQNRGTGPSVHLARELARVWGNFQYGVHELRRDDAAEQSEIQAFAWDVQTNTRSTRTFVSPHARMKGGKRQPLTDLTDIYLSNQNIGARAVRECIFAALPEWFTEEAEDLCRQTLEAGNGKPLGDRIRDALTAFLGIGVQEQQLVDRIGRPTAGWSAQDLATLEVVFRSIRNGETTRDEQFPPPKVTADEIRAHARPRQQQRIPQPPEPPEPADGEQAAEVGEGQTTIEEEPPEGVGEPVDPALKGKSR